jgi:hypothetical protein
MTVMPGSADALRHSAPRARRTTLRIRASCQSRITRAHSPSPADRSSESITRTARAAVRSASVRAGGSVFSMCTTSGSTYCGASSRLVGSEWNGESEGAGAADGDWGAEMSLLLTRPSLPVAPPPVLGGMKRSG